MSENPQTIISLVSLTVAVVSGVLGFIYFRKGRTYKELSYEVSPTLPLLNVGPEARDQLDIRYKNSGEQITDLKAVAVTIHNTGTEAVRFPQGNAPGVMDSQIPVTLDFGQSTRILREPSTETNPQDMNVRVKKDTATQSRILMETFLLNPRESITISSFLTGFRQGKPSVNWHIEGVGPPREYQRAKTQRLNYILFMNAVIALTGFVGLYGYLIYAAFKGFVPPWVNDAGTTMLVTGLAGFVGGVVILLLGTVHEHPAANTDPTDNPAPGGWYAFLSWLYVSVFVLTGLAALVSTLHILSSPPSPPVVAFTGLFVGLLIPAARQFFIR